MKFLTDFTYQNLHGFARFPGDSTTLVYKYYNTHVLKDGTCTSVIQLSKLITVVMQTNNQTTEKQMQFYTNFSWFHVECDNGK